MLILALSLTLVLVVHGVVALMLWSPWLGLFALLVLIGGAIDFAHDDRAGDDAR